MERYAAYKDSGVEWIGEIPEGWTRSKLKYIGNYINGFAFKPSDWSSVGLPIIRIQDLTGSSDSPNYYSGEIDKRYLVNPGDLLVSWAATIGAFRWRGDIAWLNQHIFKAQMNEAVCQKSYAYWLLSASIDELDHENKHGIMMAHLTGSVFNNFEVVLPPIGEQQAIVDYINTKIAEIDDIVAETERSIELLREYRKSVISEAVTKGLNPDAPMKDSGIDWIGQIPKGWQTVSLGNYAYIRARLGWRALKAEEYVEEGYPMYSAFNIQDSKFVTEPVNYITEERYLESPEIMLSVGDLLLVKDGAGVGKCAVVRELSEASTVNGSMAVITPDSSFDSRYLHYYFDSNSFQHFAHMLMGGMGVPHLFQRDIKKMKVILPNTFEEQQEIADYLDAKTTETDSLIADKEKQVELLKEYRKSLISEAVTGKFKVPGLE